jgi:DNA-binding MarR family transcriptional regulator
MTICRPDEATSAGTSAKAATTILPRHRVPAHLARRFHQICLGVTAEILGPLGWSPMEYSVLAAAEDDAGLDQRGMAKRLGIDTASASQMIDKLEKAKLVSRRINPADRRARLLRLTPAGVKFRQQLRPSLLAAQKRLLRPLSVDEQDLLLDLLSRVIEGNASYARPGNNYRKRPRKTD